MEKSDFRILVVDDEQGIRSFFVECLRSLGYSVAEASDGQQALDRCEEREYHAVVTDLNMPNIDGLTLLKRLQNRWPMIQTIVVTGFATIEASIAAMKNGAYDFLFKPVDLEQIQFTVQRCFQRWQTQMENEDLREANEELRDLSELKDKFLSIANHEMRTPLTVIKGYLDIIEGLNDTQDEETSEILQILKRASDELSSKVNRLNALSRLKRTDIAKQVQPVDIQKAIEETSRDMAGLFRTRKIDLRLEIPAEPVMVQGQSTSTRMIVREFLQNSLKFTPDGGSVTVSLVEQEKVVLFNIADTGIGIAANQQDLIFNDFYEVQDAKNHSSSTTNFMGGGMGIGLSLVRDIVDSMRGSIVVDSMPGKGSRFSVRLPRKVAEGWGENAVNF